MPGRSYSRSVKGGDKNADSINDIKKALLKIQDEVSKVMKQLEEVDVVDKNDESSDDEREEEPVVEEKEEPVVEETEEPVVEEKEEPVVVEKEEPVVVEKEEPVVEEKEVKLDDQTISINGFDGTVREMKSTMKNKASQLSKNKKNKMYTDKAKIINDLLDKISNSNDVDEIKDLVKDNFKITFKNNKLMGGSIKKTKKLRMKHKKHKTMRNKQ